MSLEAALTENTAAIRELIALYKNAPSAALGGEKATALSATALSAAAPSAEQKAAAKAKRANGEALTGGEAAAVLHGHVEAKAQTKVEPEQRTPDPVAERDSVPPPAAAAPAEKVLTYDDVKEIGMKVAKQKGGTTLLATLALFGVKTARDLDPKTYPEVVIEMNKALAA